MSIEVQGHFYTIYFPGFVCFVLYLDKISGERLRTICPLVIIYDYIDYLDSFKCRLNRFVRQF